MLLEPRLWLALAELRFIPLEAPPNALVFLALGVRETWWLPMLSPPPAPRSRDLLVLPPPILLLPGPWLGRFVVLGRFGVFGRVFDGRLVFGPPREFPPYLFAIDLLE